jgi:thioredoxin-related protein
MFGETVAVYCENRTEHTETVHTSQETHYVSAAEPNRLMLFGKTVAVYCENHTEHTDTVRTSQETHYISATDPNRLMLFGETVTVYCENHTEHTGTLWAECRVLVRFEGLHEPSIHIFAEQSTKYGVTTQTTFQHLSHFLRRVLDHYANSQPRSCPVSGVRGFPGKVRRRLVR